MIQLKLDFTDRSRPRKPDFPCVIWNDWYEMKSYGYTDQELNERIDSEAEMRKRWKKEFKQFQMQKKRTGCKSI
jgi:hypothetical protein